MARTAQLELPLVLPAQAQKHVTVNEALARLDAVAQLGSSLRRGRRRRRRGGRGELSRAGRCRRRLGRDGGADRRPRNGGWVFLDAARRLAGLGREPRGDALTFDGTDWVADALAVSPHGAGTAWRVVEFDHAVVPGATNTTAVAIPSHSQVVGVTGRVVVGLSGPG